MTKPDIYIERTCWDQIMAAVLHQDLEVQWFARGTYAEASDDRGHYIMHEIIIPPQEVQGAFTDTGENEANIGALNFIITEAQRLGSPISGWGNWGHSHVKMGTTPSAVDWKSMGELATMWGAALGIVVNQRGEVTGYGAGPHPLFKGMIVEMRNVSVAVEPMAVPAIEAVTEWMKNVTKKTYVTTYYGTGGTQSEPWASFCTKVEEVINSDTDPTDGEGFIFLSAKDNEAILDTDDYDRLSEAAYTKYSTEGWTAMTPFERKLILPDLETDTWSKRRREKALVPLNRGFYGEDDWYGQYE